jgi:hypothetical protein
MADELDLLDPSVWDEVSDDAQRELLHHGEEMVKTTLTLASGADFRAITMMSHFGAVGVALVSASVALIASGHPSWALIAGLVEIAAGLFIACGFCAAAAKPEDFFIAGFEPRNLLKSSAKKDEYRTRVLIAVTQDRIDHNRAAIAYAAQHIWSAMIAAGLSIIAGLVLFLIAFLLGLL